MISRRNFQKLIDRIAELKKIPTKIMNYGLEIYGRYYSMYEGFVFKNNDPEGRGRIKVSVPSLDLPNDEPLANWALPRFRQPAPANGSGSYWMPREGDMVFVEFLNGDLNSPVWSGGYYGEDEKPDTFDDTEKRGYKTPGGHVFRFDDEEGDESILLKHVREALLELASDDVIRVQSKDGDKVVIDPNGGIEVEHRNGASIVLTDGSIDIENNAGSAIQLDGVNQELSAGGSVTVSSPSVQVSSPSIKLGSGAISPSVKGDVLISYLAQLIVWAQSHTHPTTIVGFPTGPTITPPPIVPPNILSAIVRLS